MPPKAQVITDAEREIMKLLWEGKELTAREIREKLYPAGTLSEHATVQKLLQRLERKQLVSRNRDGFAHTFCAKITRDETLGEQLAELAETLCNGSMVPVLTHFIMQQNLTREERRLLRKILEEKEAEQ